MVAIWREGKRRLILNGPKLNLEDWITPRHRSRKTTAFYIPAHRVLTMANGWPRPFQAYASEDPFITRDFSETFRLLLEQEFAPLKAIFPQARRLKTEYRDLLKRHVFANFGLEVHRHGAQKRVVLRARPKSTPLPFMTWSAGQREFVPLLMGLYWLMPSARAKRRGDLRWVVIEEPEMGLHPGAIAVVLLLVMELLWRGYKVCLSTHSPQVLDLVWVLRAVQARPAKYEVLLDAFGVRKSPAMKKVAEAAAKAETRVYYFKRDGKTEDISALDPASERASEAGWGGLTDFSGRINDAVAALVQGPGEAEEDNVPITAGASV